MNFAANLISRYIDGIIISDGLLSQFHFSHNVPLCEKATYDQELREFTGFAIHWEMLKIIDCMVTTALAQLRSGRFVPADVQQLVCYAMSTSLTDACKFYEVYLQEYHPPYRYVPEHAIFKELLRV